MIINGDGGYGLLAAYIGGPAAQASWLGLGGHVHLSRVAGNTV